MAATDTYLEGALEGRRLLWTLMLDESVAASALDPREREVADALVEAGLMRAGEDRYTGAGLQLIAVHDALLFIDAAIDFARGRPHEVYIGPDTALLLHYLDRGRLPRGARVLDLCTGTGVIGLVAARAAGRVLLTDIADKPLHLAAINRALNDLEDVIEVRREDIADSLRGEGGWDLVTCNPPFVASPPELSLPLFARGPGRDGLDMMRDLMRGLDHLLAERGTGLLVADLIGDERLPFLVAELGPLAERFAVEVYIDQRASAEGHAATMGQILAHHNRGADPAAVAARAREFILGELGARYLYLTVLRVRRSARPGLLVCNRFRSLP